MWAEWSNGGLNDLKKKAIFIVEMYLFCVQKGVKYNTNKINHNKKTLASAITPNCYFKHCYWPRNSKSVHPSFHSSKSRSS